MEQFPIVARKFGYCKVNWKMENIYIAVHKNCYTEIISPEFYVGGLLVTKWRMMLNSNTESEEHSIAFTLKRLEFGVNFPDNSGNAYVSFSLHIRCLDSTYLDDFQVHETCIGINSSYEVELHIKNALHRAIQLLGPVDLHLSCELLVYFDSSKINFDSSQTLGFKQLGQDFLTLLENGVAYDIELGIHNMNIQAHKPILCARSCYFANKMLENPNRTRIDIGIVQDYNSLKDIIAFVYTGDLEFVLNRPSISIQRLAVEFCLSDVRRYYEPDELSIYSTISSDNYDFFWVIQDVLSRTEYLVESPLLIMGETDIIWKLKIYTRCCQNNEEFITLIAEIVEGKPFVDVFASFTVVGKRSKCLYPKRSLKIVSGKEIITYETFIKKKHLVKYLEAGDLTIIYKFRISTGKRYTSVGRSKTLSRDTEQRNYANLYKDLANLYDCPSLDDALIKNTTRTFRVHRCILAARSPNIYDMMVGRRFLFLDKRTDVLEELFHFLYTAKFRNASNFIISELYNESLRFDIKCLKKATLEESDVRNFASTP